jgi:hypothetical protein
MYFHGCRCDKCRKAEADYQRARREAKKKQREKKAATDPKCCSI